MPSSGRQTCTLSEDVSFVVNSGTAPRHTAELKPVTFSKLNQKKSLVCQLPPKNKDWVKHHALEAFVVPPGSHRGFLLPGQQHYPPPAAWMVGSVPSGTTQHLRGTTARNLHTCTFISTCMNYSTCISQASALHF